MGALTSCWTTRQRCVPFLSNSSAGNPASPMREQYLEAAAKLEKVAAGRTS